MRLTLTIDGLAPGGEGVGQGPAGAVFVPFTAPGDLVEVAIEGEAGPGPAPLRAELLRVLSPGRDRVAPPCRHFGPLAPGHPERGCGGCEWLHAAYPAQLAAKERGFRERLRRLGGLDLEASGLRPILASPRPLRYRSRAKLHLDRREGRLCFFRRRSHDPVPVAECWLLEEGLDALRAALGPALAQARLEAREVALEWSASEGRGAAWLSLPAVNPAVRERAERLLGAVPGLAGLVLQAEGERTLALAGEPVLRHERRPGEPAAGLQRSRPDVFQQANREANALLVETALAMLAPEGEEVLELFCGAGNFTGPLARRARSVAAVEAQGPALDLARADLEPGVQAQAQAQAQAHVRFFAGDALALARALGREGRRFGAALLDPPREGAKGVGPLLRDLGIPRAVYVSCDPATLARDLKACVQAGYRVAAVQPVDMFPQTHHVEGVALLVRE